VISIPVAIGAFFFIPDLPWSIKPNWIFQQSDIDLARRRVSSLGRVGPAKNGLGKKALWNVISTWHIWIFTATYCLYIFSQSEFDHDGADTDPQQSMSFWLKYSTDPVYSIEQIN
jgi:ACS family pantothenate transporter-like MFS transporter